LEDDVPAPSLVLLAETAIIRLGRKTEAGVATISCERFCGDARL
jgi:hypothetical protein